MPLPIDGGRGITWVRDPVKGTFDLSFDSTGNFAFDDTETETVLSLTLEDKGGYAFDPTGQRGSAIRTVKLDLASSASQIEGYEGDALDPAISDGRITVPDDGIKSVRQAPGKYSLAIKWHNRNGHLTNLLVPYSG